MGAARALGVALLGGSVLGAGGLASCITTESYVYTAQKYDPTADCLSAYRPVEVVNGSGAAGTCPAACLMVGADLYVSTVCPPLPTIATSVASDAAPCIAALAAAMRGGTCDNPLDGGADQDSAPDQDSSGG